MKDVMVVEDDLELREAIVDMLDIHNISYLEADNGHHAQQILEKEDVSLVLSDVQMKPGNGYQLLEHISQHYHGLPVILMTAYGSIPQAVDAIQAGASDYLVKPFDVSSLVKTIQQQMPLFASESNDGLIAVDASSLEVKQLAKKVAKSDASVLLNGESGVGKEVYSRYIHQQSDRGSGPFIAINCAAIPENMLEAALFGYEKGAFTGAVKSSVGKFEQAQGGTLLLDEISEMDLALQAKLLRVIQERQVERLGGKEVIELDVRIIATTNRNLKQEVAENRFREDLFYRLNVFPVHIPPLRDRKDDILPVTQALLMKYQRASGEVLSLSTEAEALLLNHSWPGNIRELDNVVQRALILKSGATVEAEHILLEVNADGLNGKKHSDMEPDTEGRLQNDLRDREAEVIMQTLGMFKGSRKKTADKLGISPRTLRYKLAKMRDSGHAIPD